MKKETQYGIALYINFTLQPFTFFLVPLLNITLPTFINVMEIYV